MIALPWVLAAIVAYACINGSVVWHHVAKIGHGVTAVQAVEYLSLFVASGVSLGLVLMSLSRLLLVGAFAVLLSIETTNHLAAHLLWHLRVIDEGVAEWLLSEMREAPAVVKAFFIPFATQIAISAASLVPILLVARLARRRFWARLKRPLLLTVGAMSSYALIGVVLQHEFNPNLPQESNLLVYGAKMLLKKSPDLPPADLKPVASSTVDKILLVVDESVTHRAYVSQFQDRWVGWHGVDFGDAVPLGNCSASSNSMLRWGFRADQMLRGGDPRLVPTIWSYAHAAGYRTYFVDGQRDGSYQNYMNGKEAARIDQIIGVEEGLDTDRAIARLLHTMMLEPGKMFFYINKQGSHFPYDDNYPSDRHPETMTLEQSYDAAVRYKTEDFLDIALKDVPLSRILMIYTSDHGEQLAGGSGHCNTVPSPQEKSVPLVLFTGDPQLRQRAGDAAPVLRNHVGHEQIFATLLGTMGFNLQAAEAEYGSSLLTPRVPQHYYHVAGMPIPSKTQPKTVVEYQRPQGASALAAR
jgi:hypothetical protein